ncbi:alpha/beta hydrolase [Nocardia sp. CA-119907]|uniref:alpha/beta hydrolase n=1 Tax=Nocardia sp. CA-119907 TaxID=3239973 RepID=UPI003D99FB49
MGVGGLRLASVIAAAVVLGSGSVAAGVRSNAAPDPIIAHGSVLESVTTEDGSTITAINVRDARSLTLTVYSGAMGREFSVEVQRPADTGAARPTVYLLAGVDGGTDGSTWATKTDVMRFFSDKNVNVVQPIGGAFSYYADWRAVDPVLGVNKWQTYLTRELPPLIDAALGTNGRNAIAGISTSGTSVLSLAISSPGRYRSVGAFSGCAQISDPIGQAFVEMSVRKGHGDPVNMYGPPQDPMWAANDPYVHAEGLRGLNLYLSAGSGLPGPYDNPTDPHTQSPAEGGLPLQVTMGGAIEGSTAWCTRNLRDRLDQLGIPATYDLEPTGTHSWGYWERALKDSWPVLSNGLGDIS